MNRDINRKGTTVISFTRWWLIGLTAVFLFSISLLPLPYDLGFWVRGKGIKRLILPSVSGGGLKTGETKDYLIDLKPGEYIYSCPLNPTPDYPLIVEEG